MKFNPTDVLKHNVHIRTVALLKWGRALDRQIKKQNPDYNEIETLNNLILNNAKQVQYLLKRF